MTLAISLSCGSPNVPDVAVYRVEVTHRGVLNYNAAQMEKNGWAVGSSIGN